MLLLYRLSLKARPLALLSEGQFAQVFKAEHSAYNFTLVIKVIDKTKFVATVNRSSCL